MRLKMVFIIAILPVLVSLSGCVVVTAVSVTAAAVGGAIDVVDTVTPDIFDDEDEDDEENEDKSVAPEQDDGQE